MAVRIVTLSIDKVQTFLFDTISEHTQKSQMNSGTLQNIISSSRIISEDLFRMIGVEGNDGFFSGMVKEILLKCSGVCIFSTDLEERQIKESLRKIFEFYYREYDGKLFIKYLCFETEVASDTDKLQVIRKCKKRLKSKSCLNEVIRENRQIIFEPQYSADKRVWTDEKKYPMFEETINKLYSKELTDNERYFRIAVIKADLDGMGQLFEGINSFEQYKRISKILSKYICLDSLAATTEAFKKTDDDFKLYPLYIAGDDILFAVPASYIVTGVNLCKVILREINDELGIEADHEEKFTISMSIGIEFTFNREPIRYYYERVQRQLECAKITDSEGLKSMQPHIRICMNQYVFFDCIDKDAKPQSWSHFIHDLKILKSAESEGFKVHHFMYGLLSKITDPAVREHKLKYSNAVFYHLIPSYFESKTKLGEGELLLIDLLLKQVVEKKGRSSVIKFYDKDGRVKEKFEQYIRLLLLFSDKRFHLTDHIPDYDVSNFDIQKKNIRTNVFNRVLRYLYQESLFNSVTNGAVDSDQIKKMRDLFVIDTKYKNQSGKDVQVYQTLRLSKSLLHQMKSLGADPDLDAKLIQLNVLKTKEKYEVSVETRKAGCKPPPSLYFDEKRFLDIAKSTNLWKEDYIDTLLIFNALNDQLIKYKILYPTTKNKKDGGVTKHGKNRYKNNDKNKPVYR